MGLGWWEQAPRRRTPLAAWRSCGGAGKASAALLAAGAGQEAPGAGRSGVSRQLRNFHFALQLILRLCVLSDRKGSWRRRQ